MGNVFYLAYQGMSEQDRDSFWNNLLENDNLRGQLLDTILKAERRGGPYHPEYERYLAELEEGRAAQKKSSKR
jgi:hypothetical protein